MRAFINTAHLEDGAEGFDEAGSLGAWLRGRDLLASGTGVTEGERAAAIAVREALRDLAGVNAGRPLPGCLQRAGWTRWRPPAGCGRGLSRAGRCRWRPRWRGVAGALGRLLGIVVARSGTGRWQRMKTCRNPACRWAFYDATRNRSAVWCDMAACGSRAKSRSYYARHTRPER